MGDHSNHQAAPAPNRTSIKSKNGRAPPFVMRKMITDTIGVDISKDHRDAHRMNALQQQDRSDRFVSEFNGQRPQETLDMRTPATVYTPTSTMTELVAGARNHRYQQGLFQTNKGMMDQGGPGTLHTAGHQCLIWGRLRPVRFWRKTEQSSHSHVV